MRTFNVFLNYACNARCPFCFNPVSPSPEEERGGSFDEVARQLYQGRKDGYDAVNFLGGEVTVRGDYPKIVAFARKAGYGEITMDTNGLRLADPAYTAELAAAGLGCARLSVHAPDAATHDRQVRVPGAFEKILTAIANLRASKVSVGLNCVVNKGNYKLLPEYVRYFHDVAGIRDFSFAALRYIGYMTLPASAEEMRVPVTEIVPHLRAAVAELKKRGVDSPTINDLVPCVAPDLVEHMRDWSTEPNLDGVRDPDGGMRGSAEVCHEGKSPVPVCRQCSYRESCLGPERAYVQVLGAGEFKPV